MPPADAACTSESGASLKRRDVQHPAGDPAEEAERASAGCRKSDESERSGRRSESGGSAEAAACWSL